MTAAAIAHALGSARRNRNGWLARCPGHCDHTPSLSLRDGPGGRLLAYCFAGCDWPRIREALRVRGLLQ
jgi:hypothetical protein